MSKKSVNNILPLLAADLGSGRNPVGEICAANEARFTATNFSEPLTAYAQGFRDPESLDDILQRLAPEVPVGRRFEFKKLSGDDSFLSETDDERAIGSSFKRVEFTGTSANEKTINKGLTVRVDHDDEVGSDWRERYTAMLIQRLLRNDLRRLFTILDANDTNANKTWNSSANPDKDVRDALKAASDIVGIRPNVVVFGEAAFDLRLDVYEAQNTPYAGRAAGMSPADMAAKYMVDLVEVLKARYTSAAATKTAVLGSSVFAYQATQGASKDDPSNIKRFITPTDAGRFRVYVEEHAKFTDISVEHYSNIVATATTGIRRLTCS